MNQAFQRRPLVSRTASFIAAVIYILLPPSNAKAIDPDTQHQVWAVKASMPVFHGLEIKASSDSEKRWASLKGPKFYSAPIRETPGELPSYLSWYEIRKPKAETPRSITLRDSFSGEQSFTVTLGDPAFFAMPVQTLGDGAPKQIPETLDHFIAFKIINPESVELPEPTPGKPAYVCIPAEEWHHAEHFPIKRPGTLLMVYALETSPANSKTTIIDQFGLNKLTMQSKDMVYVPATP